MLQRPPPDSPPDGEGGAFLFFAGLTAGFANVVWAVVTGVNDANTHNRASGVASVVRPEVRALGSVGAAGREPTSRGGARIGLQFVRVGF